MVEGSSSFSRVHVQRQFEPTECVQRRGGAVEDGVYVHSFREVQTVDRQAKREEEKDGEGVSSFQREERRFLALELIRKDPRQIKRRKRSATRRAVFISFPFFSCLHQEG